MPSIDERVVSAAFENAVFEQRVAVTMATLTKLDTAFKKVGSTHGLDNIEKAANKVTLQAPMSALDKLRARLGGAGKGAAEGFGEIDKAANKVTLTAPAEAVDKLQGKLGQLNAGSTFTDIEKSASRVTLDGLTRALDTVTNKFSVLQGAASVALGNIASQATMRGASFAKSFTLGPIQQGIQEYQTNLNSIQTILSNTADSGGNLKTVNAALQELNTYSDKTIYNFSEMARNIGTFTAAGVQLKPATAAIKGIANLAALSGSNSQQASTAMYQLSQAIASGKVGLQDWNSVVNAGMGGAVFQKALLRTADNMGTIEKGALKIDKATGKATVNGESFRESIMAKPGEQSWLTSDVLTKTLSQFTGDLTDAQLAAQGFSKDQIAAIQAQAKTAQAAATEVKTLSQVFDVAKETIGSGWSKTFQTIFGDFGESKKTFTNLSNTINGFINTNADARNKVLSDWKELGGRTDLIVGIRNVFRALISVVEPIKAAFRQIFPATTGKQLAELTQKFRDFTAELKIGPGSAAKLQHIFAGLFAIFDIGVQVVHGVFTALRTLFGSVSSGAGDVTYFASTLGDSLVALDKWLKDGDRLQNFFKGLGSVLSVPIELLGRIKDVIVGLFDGVDSEDGDSLVNIFDNLGERLGPAVAVLNALKSAWAGLTSIISKVASAIQPTIDTVVTSVSTFAQQIADGFSDQSFDRVFDVIQTGLLGGILLTVKKALGGGLNVDLGGGALKSLAEGFSVLTNSLKTLQTNVKANTLLQIALAMGVLTISIVALSQIDSDKLASSMTAIAVGFGQLGGAMALLSKIGGATGFAKLPFIAGSLILLAVAIDTLTIAVKVLSTLSWEELAKGLGGVGALLLGVSLAVGPLSKGSANLILVSAGLIVLGVALRVIAEAVQAFGDMDWATIGKGLIGVAGSLVAIGLAMSLVPPTGLAVSVGMVAMAVALNLIAKAVQTFGDMSLVTMAKGLLGIGASLVVIGLAMALMPPHMALQAAALILVSIALQGLGAAIAVIGGMSIGTLAKGIIAIGAALVVLAAGLTLMIVSLPGAAALLVAAAALAILVPVIGTLGNMSWGTIVKGLAAIAATMLVIGAAGVIAAPALAILGLALVSLGAGLTLVGAGVYLIGKGISLLAKDGSKGVAVFIAALTGLIAIIPKLVIDFFKGIVSITSSIANLAPLVAVAIGKVLNTMLDVIISAAPKIGQGATAIITAFVKVLVDNAPQLVSAGFKLLNALLDGLNQNITKITNKAAEIATKFLTALANAAPRIVTAGANLLAAILRGIANNISKVVTAAASITNGIIRGLGNSASKLVSAGADLLIAIVRGVTNSISKVVTAGVNIVAKLATGLVNAQAKLLSTGVSLVSKLINSMAKAALKLVDVGATAVIGFINGMANTIRTREPELIAAMANLGLAMVQGLVRGLGQINIASILGTLMQSAINAAKSKLRIKSPSKVFHEIGQNVVEGFVNGVTASASSSDTAAIKLANRLIKNFKDILAIQGTKSKVLTDLGEYVGKGFAEGLRGSSDDIENAFDTLNGKLTDSIANAKETIATEQDRLNKLLDAKKLDYGAIAKAQAVINQNQILLDRSKAARTELTKELSKQKTVLEGLSLQYDEVTTKLKEAQSGLEAAISTRDSATKSLHDKFAELPDVAEEGVDTSNSLTKYVTDLKSQATAVEKYRVTLEQLKALGIDDATYQKLLDEGPAAQKFADELIAGGAPVIAAINALDTQIDTSSSALATSASTTFYQAGVDSAQALVTGLSTQQAGLKTQIDTMATGMTTAITDALAISAQSSKVFKDIGVFAAKGLADGLHSKRSAVFKRIREIAEGMINELRKSLGIKSPSRVFAELGVYAAEGMAKGISSGGKAVNDAVGDMGDDATDTMRSSISRMSNLLANEINSNPTISPVLDLTYIRNQSKQLAGILAAPLSVNTSYGQASAISLGTNRPVSTSENDLSNMPIPEIKFEQNNYSPEALSQVDIYRQTRNQLSQAKKMLVKA